MASSPLGGSKRIWPGPRRDRATSSSRSPRETMPTSHHANGVWPQAPARAESDDADVQPARLNALTGLRFVAAAMIVAAHARWLNISFPAAFDHGVSFFFVLSGFILAYVYPRLPTWTATANFLVARIARLWPAHCVGLLFAIAVARMPIDRTL